MGCEQSALSAVGPDFSVETMEKSTEQPHFNSTYIENDIAQQKHVGKFFPQMV